jgi:hypothetical protein
MNSPIEKGPFAIVSQIDGSVIVLRDGKELKRFLNPQQAEAFVAEALFEQGMGRTWLSQDLGQGLEQTISPGGDFE